MDDSYFGPTFVDVDEWRDAPVRHRYVHGGFEGTDTRFSFYFPPGGTVARPAAPATRRRQRRSREHRTGRHGLDRRHRVRGRERLLPRGVQPGSLRRRHADPASASRPSVHSAPARNRRATPGSSPRRCTAPRHTTATCSAAAAGRARCLLCLEQCPDVWQGAVPYIMGHSTSWSLGFSVQAHAARVLGPQMAGVIDAVEPGGSGDPFDGLNPSSARRSPRCTAPASRAAPSRRSARRATRARSRRTSPRSRSTTRPTSTTSGPCPATWAPTASSPTSLVEEKTTVTRVVTVDDLAATGDPRGRMLLMFSGGGAGDTPAGVVLDGMSPAVMVGAAMRFGTGDAAGPQAVLHRRGRRHAPRRGRHR